MQRTQLIDELKLLRKRHRNDKYATFETRWIDVLDAVIGELEESNWHTGTPTEEGWYLIAYKWHGDIRYIAVDHIPNIYDNAIAWQKIEPFKETDNE